MICHDLIAPVRRNEQALQALALSTDLNGFGFLHPETKRLIQNWFGRATHCWHQPKSYGDRDSFEGLIFAWIAFNGWASCVTDKDSDKEMIEALSLNETLCTDFSNLLSSDPSFREAASDFHSHWPIFKAQELADLDIWVPMGTSREDRVNEYLRKGAKKFSPPCWKRHKDALEEVPLDWPHTISAIYQLRCNLFHGHKGTRSPNDRELVNHAFRVLMHFLSSGGYIQDATLRR